MLVISVIGCETRTLLSYWSNIVCLQSADFTVSGPVHCAITAGALTNQQLPIQAAASVHLHCDSRVKICGKIRKVEKLSEEIYDDEKLQPKFIARKKGVKKGVKGQGGEKLKPVN